MLLTVYKKITRMCMKAREKHQTWLRTDIKVAVEGK